MAFNQRWMTWSLAAGAFVVALGVAAWYEGPWSGGDAPTTQRAVTQMPVRPFGPPPSATPRAVDPAPIAVAEATSPAPEALPEVSNTEPQTEPYNTPEVDNGEMQALRDRAAAHSARSH
jgi:hypothetical protein